ncbi:ubiquitin thioesterase Zranb1-like [Tachypleus tridentatus]|uniref:ubiquitin thioesterase Zranb1-like n=1 Tax=Tachypleus tridentatus TaxID=6853 RepID=UPI003FD0DFB5
MSQDSRKWACGYCTYENWPKAKKCTLCLAARPPHIITEEASKENDIYKITPLIQETTSQNKVCTSDNTVTSTSSPSDVGTFRKWSCQICTFLNWPRSEKCTQCLSPWYCSSLTSNQVHLGSPGPTDNKGDIHTPERTVPPPLPLVVQTDRYENIRNKSCSEKQKWNCSACTYENWPKSQKCVLCGTGRIKSPGSYMSETEEGRSPSSPISNQIPRRASPPGLPNYITTTSSIDSLHRRTNNRQTEAAIIQGHSSVSCTSESTQVLNNYIEEQRQRQQRRKPREFDRAWLNACMGVIDGDLNPVIHYLSIGGDPARQLTSSDVALLSRTMMFEVGKSLTELAVQYQRDEVLAILLPHSSHPIVKRAPPDVNRSLSRDIRRHIATSLKQRIGEFSCYFVTEFVTFTLPAEIEDFARPVTEKLFDELLDRYAQKELEEEAPVINWSIELTDRLGSRLYVLWNRSAGDCLLDSALQATWGVFDRDNTLRRALGESLCDAAPVLYPRWREAETLQANLLNFTLDDFQWQEDWATLLSLATQPGSALEQMHVFTLAHILRRPIIVYGVKYVKNLSGEALGYARFEGIYLPLLWECSFCWKSPIALGYTRGHFSALVTMEPDLGDVLGAGANMRPNDDQHVVFLPLVSTDQKLLPVHFLTQSELGREEEIIHQWLDCCVTEGGILVAQQKVPKRPLLVAQMIEEWLDFYRNLDRESKTSTSNITTEPNTKGYSSEGDSEHE